MSRVKEILKGIAQTEHVANGYVFVGAPGCGKTTAAIDFFKYLNCENPGETFCGTCSKCKHIASGQASDLYQVIPERSIKIEQIRELKKYVQYGPSEMKYLLVIVQHVDLMTTEAANSFLKLLEEPPERVFFILETSQVDAVIKTILSRCQRM